MYELPNFNFNFNFKNRIFWEIIILIVLVCILFISINYQTSLSFLQKLNFEKIEFLDFKKTEEIENTNYVSEISYEQAIINVVKNASPSVVSIVISKNLPVYEQEWVNPFGDDSFLNIQVPQYVQKGTEYQKVGSGSGFIVSGDGLILTNKHVVSDKNADYSVITNDGAEYDAKVLAVDPVQDLAILKIEDISASLTGSLQVNSEQNQKFQPLKLGDSSGIQIGQTAIAIGNALGEFSNTVSVGVVSGLGRTISASDKTGAIYETLEDIIQTDAAINSGNSGGPLLNLKGEVIGINTAIAENAQSIAFAIPINYAKKDISQVIATNKIVYPFLGVRYILITEKVKEKYNLSVNYGAFVQKGEGGEVAVIENSAAQKAGIKEEDIILEINGEKISAKNTLAKIIQKYNAGDSVVLKVLRNNENIELQATLGERVAE
jgi:serine protease Do